MAKRFTDTDKWKKHFIKSLPAEYKLFWLFILDECDHSGVWHVELEIAEVRLGIKLSIEKIRGFFKERIVEFDSGRKFFIPDFIHFQYGSLNESNNAHRSVLSILRKYNLMGHISPSRGAMDKDKEMDMDKDMDKDGKKYSIEECLMIALRDSRFIKANKTDDIQLHRFNEYLEQQGKYLMNPNDYKSYFAKLKGRYPEMMKKEMTIEELRELAKKMDQQ